MSHNNHRHQGQAQFYPANEDSYQSAEDGWDYWASGYPNQSPSVHGSHPQYPDDGSSAPNSRARKGSRQMSSPDFSQSGTRSPNYGGQMDPSNQLGQQAYNNSNASYGGALRGSSNMTPHSNGVDGNLSGSTHVSVSTTHGDPGASTGKHDYAPGQSGNGDDCFHGSSSSSSSSLDSLYGSIPSATQALDGDRAKQVHKEHRAKKRGAKKHIPVPPPCGNGSAGQINNVNALIPLASHQRRAPEPYPELWISD